MAVFDLLGMFYILLHIVTSSAQEHPINVAVNKTATQSSTFDGTDVYTRPPVTYRASADLAVDGAPTKNYLDKTCAVSDWLTPPHCTDNPWWQVDLGGLYDVFNVTIYQRGEREADKQTYGPLVVRVGNHVELPENRTRYTDRPVVSVPLSPPVTASTVHISIPGCAILQLCEVEVFAVRYISECASSPCQHGGSCRDLVGNFECVCLPGYTGTQCQTDIDECASFPCYHGSCTDGVNSYTCKCQPGYTGLYCLHDIYECASSPCVQGATCHDYVNSYNCTCAAGFTGRNCEFDVDECKLNYCQNAATCVNTHGSYSCSCTVGYKGNNCSEECQTGWYGLECSQTCPSCQDGYSCHHVHGACPPRDRLAEGVGIGLGVGLGAFLLLALGAFVLLRWRRRQKASTDKASPSDLSMTPRQPVAVTRQQEAGSPDQAAGHYESLDDATKDRGSSSPYSGLGQASRGREAASPYSNEAV